MSDSFDHIFNVLVIGDSTVGKTCLVSRFTDDVYQDGVDSTAGADLTIRTIQMDGKKIKLQIWDTAGQDRYKSITFNYYRKAHGIIIAYDPTKKESFDHVDEWFAEVLKYAPDGVNKLLLAGKSDLKSGQTVSVEEAQAKAEKLGIEFVEASSKTSSNVDVAFRTLVKSIKTRFDACEQAA